ncbi:MAG: tRNA (adenosine(37)-N6)-threonylcarbamoyltransferase complex dimerization subunit type 1 TsaB [Candidatus Lightella neohaematopini]|nr:tRNA (adenosine(37)-N6)-threonylcarbamoyltransferase complex dimerization subunit type 1 TsaB [Candidatus Lightella neohaematopini]
MNILIINNATIDYSIALIHKYSVTLCGVTVNNNDYINYLLTTIDRVLYNSNISLKKLNVLAFNNGPGSFTKVRIINSIAQGLSLNSNITLINISNLIVLAEGAWRCTKANKILVINYAYNNKSYVAKYQKVNNKWYLKNKIILLNVKDITTFCNTLSNNWILTGDIWLLNPEIKIYLNNKFTIISNNNCNILDMCTLVVNKLNTNKLFELNKILPIYI